MSIQIHFERSETCAEAHGLPEGRITTVVADDTEGPWLQLTYETLRSQDGAVIAFLDDKTGDWFYEGQPFSDVVIGFAP